MTNKIPMPGNLSQVKSRFLGKFTIPDMVRLAVPVGLASLVVSPSTFSVGTGVLAGLALAVSLTWYLWTPYGQHLDTHLYHAVRWLIEKQTVEGSDLAEQNKDHVITENGVAVGVVEVSPTNLEMKTGFEQGAVHSTFQQLLQTINYPVYIYSRQQPLSLDQYIEHIEDQEADDKLLKDDYINYLQQLVDGTHTATRHYLVIRVEPDSLSWAGNQLAAFTQWLKQLPYSHRNDSLRELLQTNPATDPEVKETVVNELESRCREVQNTLDTSDINLDRLTKRDLYHVVQKFNNRNPSLGISWTTQPGSNDTGEYRKTVCLDEYPSSLELGWPLQLLRVNGLVDFTQVVEPCSPAKTTTKLQRLSEKLNAEIGSFLRQGYYGTHKLEALLEDVQWMLDLLADREDQPVQYSAYVSVHQPERERCEQSFQQLCNRLQTMQIGYRLPVFRTDQAYKTDSPLHNDPLHHSQLMPAGSAAAGFPFATQEPRQSQGVIHGVDTADETPVLLDRFNWSSHSMARMGMVGSGKSYAAKIELFRSYLSYRDLQIYIVDPKQEYRSVIRSLNGEQYTLGEDEPLEFTGDVIGYTVAERGQEDNVDQLVDLVQQIYNETSQNTRKTLVLIDEARILLNDERGRRILNQFVLEGRDTNTAISLVTQNASHFTYCREGREILDNMPGKVFMRHDRVPDSVVNYFDLSNQERQKLFELKTGTDSSYSEALVKVTGRIDTRIRVEATPQEKALLNNRGGSQ